MTIETALPEVAAKGFTAGAKAYERTRPTYPAQAVNYLIEAMDLGPGATVLDLGAGTGKFTRLLLPTGAKIVAVEPIAEMRSEFETVLPEVELLAGTAESIPLADASVDAVICAQAFHWFNADKALPEIHRVLKPAGKLGLIWNQRQGSDEWEIELEKILAPLRPSFMNQDAVQWKQYFHQSAFFDELQEACSLLPMQQSPAELLERMASISFVAALPPLEKSEVLQRIEDLLSFHASTTGRELIEYTYRTEVYWCQKKIWGTGPAYGYLA